MKKERIVRAFLNWIAEFWGGHVCFQFETWVKNSRDYSRPVTGFDHIIGGQTQIEFTRTWQERRCLDCGYVQQERLQCGGADPQKSQKEVHDASKDGQCTEE